MNEAWASHIINLEQEVRQTHARLAWDEDKTLRLFRAYHRTGSSEAKEELYLYYVNLVEFFVMQYAGKGAERDDLFQEGSLALLTAIERFDPSKGFRFSTYSSTVIKGCMRQYFRNSMWPCHVSREYKELSLHLHRLTEQLGYVPNAEEAERLAGIPLHKFDDVLAAAQAWSTVPISEDIDKEETDATIAYRVRCIDRDLEEADERMTLHQAIEDNLTVVEANTLYLYYYADLPQHEIADRMGTYQMGVSRVLQQGLAKLEMALSSDRMVS